GGTLPFDQLARRLEPFGRRLAIAAVNGPDTAIVSGDVDAIDQLLAELAREQVFTSKVRRDIAGHSDHVEPLRAELLAELAPLQPRPTDVPLYSTVTGDVLDGRSLDAEYWYRNMREPVRFADATRSLLAGGHRF